MPFNNGANRLKSGWRAASPKRTLRLRGRSYPGLCTATGERVGVIGALTVEGAASALKSRDVDAMIIGEGFGTRVVEALLTVLAEDARFRDLPVAVVGKHSAVGENFAAALPNLERIADGPQRVIEHCCPIFAFMLSRAGSSACSPRSTPRARSTRIPAFSPTRS